MKVSRSSSGDFVNSKTVKFRTRKRPRPHIPETNKYDEKDGLTLAIVAGERSKSERSELGLPRQTTSLW